MRQLLYCWVSSAFYVLIPKKRGDGFLRVPYGHHYDAGLAQIEAAARCDLYGLDGALSFHCPRSVFHGSKDQRAEFVGRVIPLLEKHYNLPAVEIREADYWMLHPLIPDKLKS